MVWAYMGPRDKMPPPPDFEWTQVPETHRHVSKVWEECNWLQALEGGIDTSHAPILHRAIAPNAIARGCPVQGPFVRGRAPTLEVDMTDYGYRYCRHAPARRGQDLHARLSFRHAVHADPAATIGDRALGGGDRSNIAGHIWVPIDDDNSMVWNWMSSFGEEALQRRADRMERGNGNGPDYVEQSTSSARSATQRNDWTIDREVQKYETFTGIDGVNTQDRAVQESMGPIVDRSKEHLGPADRAIIATRRLLLRGGRDGAGGRRPSGCRHQLLLGARHRENLPA